VEGKNGEVILWADTFNNHFHPTTAQAALEVLEDAGYSVTVPMQNLCCGRPLYDYGFLEDAKKFLQTVLATLREDIRKGTRIVMLEPSCCSVFRDELVNLFPNDEDAKRLSDQTCTLAEFLAREEYDPPKLKRKAMLHGHCHQKAIMKMSSEEALLRKMGLDLETPDTGCCGMAGAFGFEPGEHYDVSIACGERVLLPAVREAAEDELIIADGFSCREQVTQETDRVPLHFAQVVQMALKEGPKGAPGPKPERAYVKPPRNPEDEVKTAVLVGATLLALGLGMRWVYRSLDRSSRELEA
jgi:Fe-S oxidoreductase